MRMQRIRDYYGIPVRRGMQVTFQGEQYRVTGTTRGPMYVRIRPASGGKSFAVHPTWEMIYDEEAQ